MKKFIQSSLILITGIISGAFFYIGASSINDIYTKDFFKYVAEEVSFAYEILSEQVYPVIVEIDGKLAAVYEAISKDEEIKKEQKLVIRDAFTKYQLPSKIQDTLTMQTVVISSVGKTLVVDMDSMVIYMYKNGILVGEVSSDSELNISKGEYEIQEVEYSTLLSIGEVSDFVDLGTKIIVVGGEGLIKEGEYIDYGNGISGIDSDSYLVADLYTGEVVLEKNIKQIYPIASLSKLMTALVSIESIDQSVDTKISRNAVGTYGNQGGLKKGENINVGELLYPLLLESSNDAAEAIAEVDSRQYFMKLMNHKAKSLGLLNTSFYDPSGLSEYNISTAEDLFRLVQHINKNNRYILDLTMIPVKDHKKHIWRNISRFIKDDRYTGSKNGYTDEALKTLIVTYNIDFNGIDRPIAIVLLHGTDSTGDVRAILKYLSKNVEYLNVGVAS